MVQTVAATVVGPRVDKVLPPLTRHEAQLIAAADALAHGVLAEHAAAVDRGTRSVRDNLDAIAVAGLAGLGVPREYGGAGVEKSVPMRVLEALAYGDGTTPFVIAQHYGASGIIAASPNADLARALLPRLATGEQLCGFGISQVRRAGKPVLAAVPDGDGYRFDGSIPWMTGYGLFDHLIVAGTLPDGQVVLALVPFAASDHLRIDGAMELVAMNGAGTVAATVDGLCVGAHQVLEVEPGDKRVPANRTGLVCHFGLIRASIDDLHALGTRRSVPAHHRAADRLQTRLDALRTAYDTGTVSVDEARAAGTTLAFDAIVGLTIAVGGGANAATHPAQRRLREASVFATWGLSTSAAEEALAALA